MHRCSPGCAAGISYAAAMAVPRWAYDDAKIADGRWAYDDATITDGNYRCMQTSNCAGLKVGNVQTKHDCCDHLHGGGFWNFVTCSPW